MRLSFSVSFSAKSFWVIPFFSRASLISLAESSTTVSTISIVCFLIGVREIGALRTCPNPAQFLHTCICVPSTSALSSGTVFPHSSQALIIGV